MNVPDLPDIRPFLEELQGGRCGICGHSHELELDHDHRNGFIRGLVCAGCNNQEGRHPECEIPESCPICRWRHYPATSWLGWTESYARYSPTTFDVIVLQTMRDRWQPTIEMATGVLYHEGASS